MVEFTLSFLINIITFSVLTSTAYTIFYFSSKMNPDKRVSSKMFLFSLGVNLIALSHLFRLWNDISPAISLFPFIIITIATGSVFTFIGVVGTFHEKTVEINAMRKRYEDITSTISALKEKYYKQEISENELRSISSDLLKELTEIEVKLKGKLNDKKEEQKIEKDQKEKTDF